MIHSSILAQSTTVLLCTLTHQKDPTSRTFIDACVEKRRVQGLLLHKFSVIFPIRNKFVTFCSICSMRKNNTRRSCSHMMKTDRSC